MSAKTHGLIDLLREAAWLFGNKAFDGSCCEGLSFMEYQALAEIQRSEDCPIQGVAKAIGFTKSGATRIVDRLERKGHVRKRRSPVDGRVCCVALTRRGKDATAAIMRSYAAYLGDVLKELDVRSAKRIAGSLESLIAAARRPRTASR
ncbi:MAG TPA: MarR family transcriptional regulator [Candidatus Aminicenantes bacterium]|nr:MarR family transcriptional regulator [Candidatus Aminicenantes bacterium]HRY63929.1 MarR family transcriptional regulator [Candidatus Aminicenantes bacterium]HRZ70842.1 MarR family transcriptional regulator [Candidatus Aminicenantes bacterium]